MAAWILPAEHGRNAVAASERALSATQMTSGDNEQ